MFNTISKEVQDRMKYLSKVDEQDRLDGTPRLKRLRQIPEETGKFIALLLATAPKGVAVEIGTSAGYSTLLLSLACNGLDKKLYTFELLEEKIKLAKETFEKAKVNDRIKLVEGNAIENLERFDEISFCFLDAEKEIYSDIYDVVIPKMVQGGIFVADNAISHRDSLGLFIEKAMKDPRVDVVLVPIGTGELICRVI